MAGSTTAELPCQATEDAKKMAILLAGPSGEDPRRAAGGNPAEEPPEATPARTQHPVQKELRPP
jgi:hypothetical protein